MKSLAILAVLVAAALAAPANPDADAQIISYDNDNIGVEGFRFGFETSNGIRQTEQGVLKNAGSENEAIEVTGQFGYRGDDGVEYVVTYVANENGFQPKAPHIPQAA